MRGNATGARLRAFHARIGQLPQGECVRPSAGKLGVNLGVLRNHHTPTGADLHHLGVTTSRNLHARNKQTCYK